VRGSRGEAGFTLIETLIVVIILPIVLVGVTAAIMTTLQDDGAVSTRLADSHDAQITSAFFVDDVEGAMWITTGSAPICGTGSQVVGVAWQPASGVMAHVSYSTGTGRPGLVRTFCSSATTTVSTVSHDLASSTSALATATCSSSYPSCAPGSGLSPAVEVASVQLQITEQSGYTYTLAAVPRLYTTSAASGTPPGSSPPALLLLGGGTDVASCAASSHASPLDVNGLAAVDSSAADSLDFTGHATLTADQVYSQDSSTSGSSAPVQPPSVYSATTSQPYSSGPPIPDPYSGLPDPSTAGLTTQSSTSSLPGPGVYNSPVTITSSQTIGGGTYIFEGGLSVAGGGGGGGTVNVTSGGASVLFFIGVPGGGPPQSAVYSVTGQAAVNLTGMTSGPYSGIVLFQSRSDTNEVDVAGQGTTSFYGGAVYAPDATVSTSGNGNTYATSVVAKSLRCGGNGTTGLGPGVVASNTSVTSSNPNSLSGQSVTFTATVSASTGPTPAGTVSFAETPTGSSTPVAMCTNVALVNGQASCSSPPLSVAGSPYTITATYAGNLTFQSSTGTTNQNVSIAPTTTSVSSSPSSPVTGQHPITFTASVSPTPDAGSVTWTISYGVGGSVSCGSTTALSGGTATCTISSTVLLAANSPYTVTANYSGDTSYSGSSGSLSLVVSKAGSSTTASSPGNTSAGSVVTLTAAVSAVLPGSGAPGGTVVFSATNTKTGTKVTLCTATIVSGAASCSAASPPKGSWTLSATYSGDTNFAGSSGTAAWKTS